MKKTKKMVQPRLYFCEPIKYVLAEDIEAVHGKRFAKKFAKLNAGGTGILVVTEKTTRYGSEKTTHFGIYYEDYERFYKQITHGTPTYFD